MKLKKIICLVTLCLSLFLVSCSRKDQNYLDKGYTSVVKFDFNGGIMTNAVTDIDDSIKYAYEPNSFICDPTTLPSCTLKKKGFDFLGWYKDEACSEPWDFKTDKIHEDSITLYAKWGTSIHYTYTLCYIDEATKEVKSLYTYTVEADEVFTDFLNRANTRENYTAFGLYKDQEFKEPWDESFKHPGGDKSLDIKIYVQYIPGTYTLVSTYEQLMNAKGNIYLLNSIDCGGKILDFGREFQSELQGNGYTISNFKIEGANRLIAKYSIFESLLDGAKIENVTFDTATIEIPVRSYYELGIGGLAGEAEGAVVISNVTIKNSKIVIPAGLKIEESVMNIKTDVAVYDVEADSNLTIENFVSNYKIEDQRN